MHRSRGPCCAWLILIRLIARLNMVSGAGWTFSEQPLSIVLSNTRGEVVGTAEAELVAPEPGLVGVFETTLEYDIPRRTWGLLTVNEYDENHEFIIHTSSVILLMNP